VLPATPRGPGRGRGAQRPHQQFERTRDLRAQGFVSQAALDVRRDPAQGRPGRRAAGAGGRSQAALARGFALVTAPFDGIVLATHVEAGDLAAPGRPLATLYAPGRLRAVVQVPVAPRLARAAPRVECNCPTAGASRPPARTELPAPTRCRRPSSGGWTCPPPPWPGWRRARPVQVRFAGAPPAAAGGRPSRRACVLPRQRRAAARRADRRLRRAGQTLRAARRAPGRRPRRWASRCWPA
jgi:multidrug efflux pump subunit AcrA (membrane-fusion protein)